MSTSQAVSSSDVSVESRLNAMKGCIARGASQLKNAFDALDSVCMEPDLAMRIRQMQVNDGHRIGDLFLPLWYDSAQNIEETLAIFAELIGGVCKNRCYVFCSFCL